jgi:hypothetical protein
VCDHVSLAIKRKVGRVSLPIGHPSEVTKQYESDQVGRSGNVEQRLTIQRGDKIRFPDNHPNAAGQEGIVVMCGMYQVRVRLIRESRETWAFSNDVTILRKG